MTPDEQFEQWWKSQVCNRNYTVDFVYQFVKDAFEAGRNVERDQQKDHA